MNEDRLRAVYVVGLMASAYVFWYVFTSFDSILYAVPFALATVFFVARLRLLTADS
ncbi:hypothetical protein [Natrinema marinum]|uniref:hypothetical protein n=1 Tax=Natrinema marinum TaxID=2961598 RepID=UPI0020C84137|nr:hypothetical protein [Natrinema marinum]